MRFLSINHIALQVANLDLISRFYGGLLGLPELRRHFRADGTLRSIWYRLGEGVSETPFLAVEANEGSLDSKEGVLGYSMVALQIEAQSRAQWLQHFAAHGIPVEHETRWTVYVRDPEGNRVGLSHYPFDLESPKTEG